LDTAVRKNKKKRLVGKLKQIEKDMKELNKFGKKQGTGRRPIRRR